MKFIYSMLFSFRINWAFSVSSAQSGLLAHTQCYLFRVLTGTGIISRLSDGCASWAWRRPVSGRNCGSTGTARPWAPGRTVNRAPRRPCAVWWMCSLELELVPWFQPEWLWPGRNWVEPVAEGVVARVSPAARRIPWAPPRVQLDRRNPWYFGPTGCVNRWKMTQGSAVGKKNVSRVSRILIK